MSRYYDIVVNTLPGAVRVLTMIQPSRAEAHHNRGALLLANEEYKKALIELNKAISIDPLDANFRHTRAWALWRLEQTQQALDELKFAINLSPDSNLLDSLGSFLFMLGQYDQALRIYSKAISKAASAAEAALYLRKRGATFLALDQTDFAILDLNKAIEINPGDPLNYRERSEVYESLGRLEETIADCSRAIESVKDDPVLYKRRGQCYFAQDKLGPALEDAQAAIKIEEHYSDAHLLLGKVLLEDGQVSIAMQFFVTAFSFDHKCAEAYLNLALCFDLLKSPKEAHQYSRKAAALNPALKKYTLEATRLTLISPNTIQRMQTFSANVHQFDPALVDDDSSDY
jgi:tetratricopeptide (TPR) repeat protein